MLLCASTVDGKRYYDVPFSVVSYLSGIWRPDGLQVVHMLAHCDKEIEEEFTTLLHFSLHGTALLEVVAVSNDYSEIMAAEIPLSRRCMVVDPSR